MEFELIQRFFHIDGTGIELCQHPRLIGSEFAIPDQIIHIGEVRRDLTLHPAETERLMDIRETLTRLGFETSLRGNLCRVESMPPEMDRSEASAFLREAVSGRVDDLEDRWILLC